MLTLHGQFGVCRALIAGAVVLASPGATTGPVHAEPRPGATVMALAATYPTANAAARDFIQVEGASHVGNTASNVLDLVAPIMRGHPERLEGRPTGRVRFAKSPAGGLVVEVTMTGYLDDSLAGERFLGFVTRDTAGWTLASLWRQNLCWRGPVTKTWTKQRCS